MIDTSPRIVLCLPGPWETFDEIAARLRGEPGWELQGEALIDADVGLRVELDHRPGRDARMREAFAAAASLTRPSLGPAELAAIDAHRSVLYLVGAPFESDVAPAAAHGMMRAAAAVIRAGGLGVKCESSGLAHSAERWIGMERAATEAWNAMPAAATSADRLAIRFDFWEELHAAYVKRPIARAADLYSCGMHLLGSRDAIIGRDQLPAASTPPSAAGQSAADLLDAFQLYELAECGGSGLTDGHIYQGREDQPRFALGSEPCASVPPDDLFWNPFGCWRLLRLGA